MQPTLDFFKSNNSSRRQTSRIWVLIYQNTAGGAQAALTAVLPQVPSWERFLQKSSSETKLLVGHLPLTPPCQSHCWTPTWQQHGWDEGCLLFITHLIGSLEARGDGKQLFVGNLAGNVQPQRSAEHCLHCAGLEGPPAPRFVPLGSPAPPTPLVRSVMELALVSGSQQHKLHLLFILSLPFSW